MKSLHKNSCIYRANIKRLAEKFGCSRTKIRHHLKIFFEQNWCFWHKGNLCFRSAKAIHHQIKDQWAKKYISISTVEEITFHLVDNKLNQQQFIRDKVRELENNGISWKQKKKVIKKFGSEIRKIGTGLWTMSNVIHQSISHTSLLLRNLENAGLLSIERRLPLLVREWHDALEVPKGFYYANGWLCKRQTNVIISQQPCISCY